MKVSKKGITIEGLVKALRCMARVGEDDECTMQSICNICPYYTEEFNLGVPGVAIDTVEKLCEAAANTIESQHATIEAAYSDIRELLLRGLKGHEKPVCLYCAVQDANECDEHGCVNIAAWRGLTKEDTEEEPHD